MQHIHVDLAPDAKSVGSARRTMREALESAAADDWVDSAVLAVSEVITNAVVHTGSQVSLDVWASPDGVRVEVVDGSDHLPALRTYAVTSGTGRGLHILDQNVERWGAEPRPPGKVVWFELGEPPRRSRASSVAPSAAPLREPQVAVTLRSFPLLMHWAWQEHAQALLREYLLFGLEVDPEAIDRHAHAGYALSLLHEQIPIPQLPDDPAELLADAVEPAVTADEFVVSLPRMAAEHFSTLDSTLDRAREAAARGLFLGPATQPELVDMRRWICQEVTRQCAADREPRPWRARTNARAPVADGTELRARYRALSASEEAILAADEAGIIVAVTPSVVEFLGYPSEDDLLGRRLLVVIPERYHQAHIAGITLNATNGRRQLLDVPIRVPVVRADAAEILVELDIGHRLLGQDSGVFVARFTLPDGRRSEGLAPTGR